MRKTWDRFIREMKSPFAFLSMTLAILALLLSVYLYIASKPDTSLYYFVGNTIEIVSRSLPSKVVSVSRSDGQPILGNVYVVKIFIWAGKDTKTSNADIRKPLSMEIDGAHIIEASILSATHAPISKFSFAKLDCSSTEPTAVSLITPTPQSNHVELYWCVFDSRMGTTISVIYDAPKPAKVSLDGYISGISAIKNVPEFESELRRSGNVLTYFAPVFFICGYVIIVGIFIYFGIKRSANLRDSRYRLVRTIPSALRVLNAIWGSMMVLGIAVFAIYYLGKGVYLLAIESNLVGVGSSMPPALQEENR